MTWKTEEFDASIPGLQYLSGTVVVPEGYAMGESFDASRLLWSVLVTQEGMEPLPIIYPVFNGSSCQVFPVGNDLASYNWQEERFFCYLNDLRTDYVDVGSILVGGTLDGTAPGAYWAELFPDIKRRSVFIGGSADRPPCPLSRPRVGALPRRIAAPRGNGKQRQLSPFCGHRRAGKHPERRSNLPSHPPAAGKSEHLRLELPEVFSSC